MSLERIHLNPIYEKLTKQGKREQYGQHTNFTAVQSSMNRCQGSDKENKSQNQTIGFKTSFKEPDFQDAFIQLLKQHDFLLKQLQLKDEKINDLGEKYDSIKEKYNRISLDREGSLRSLRMFDSCFSKESQMNSHEKDQLVTLKNKLSKIDLKKFRRRNSEVFHL